MRNGGSSVRAFPERTFAQWNEGAIEEVVDAKMEGVHFLIELFGGPMTGKTLSGLLIGRGLVGPDGVLGMMDTESGRGRMYAKSVPGGYKYLQITPPFTPEAYMDGVTKMLRVGCRAIVIDSQSHVWEGIGGVLEQADALEAGGAKGRQKWNKPKRGYNRLISFLITTNCHIILCARAKQPLVDAKDSQGRDTYVKGDWVPIHDDRLRYEMTIVLPMMGDGRFSNDPEKLFKCPGELRHLFADTQQPPSVETGALIAKWAEGGEPYDPHAELLMRNAELVAEEGMQALLKHADALPETDKAILRTKWGRLRRVAMEADAMADEVKRVKASTEEEAGQEQRVSEPFADPPASNGNAGNGKAARFIVSWREGQPLDSWAREALEKVTAMRGAKCSEADFEAFEAAHVGLMRRAREEAPEAHERLAEAIQAGKTAAGMSGPAK